MAKTSLSTNVPLASLECISHLFTSPCCGGWELCGFLGSAPAAQFFPLPTASIQRPQQANSRARVVCKHGWSCWMRCKGLSPPPPTNVFHTLLHHPCNAGDGGDRWHRHNQRGKVRKHLAGRGVPTPFQPIALVVCHFWFSTLEEIQGL